LGEQFDVPTFFERIKENPFLNSLTQYELSGALYAFLLPLSCI